MDNPAGHIATVGAYNPYNGREALDIIMKRIYNQLREDQQFGTHLALTHFSFNFALTFQGETMEPVVIKGKSKQELRQVDKSFTVTSESAQAPDDGRREAGLAVPAPTLTSGGMVDLPIGS